MGSTKKPRRGITKIKDDLWRVRVYWEGRQWHVGTYEKEEFAEIALDIARGQLAAGTFVPPAIRRKQRKAEEAESIADRLTVREWSDQWLELLRIAGRSEGTLVTYQSALRVHILPILGDMRLIDVKRSHIQKMLDDIDGPGARSNAHRTMRSMFLAAVKSPDTPLKDSPVTDLSISQPKRRKAAVISSDKLLEVDDLEAVTEAMPPELQIAVTLAGWCATRLGEVLGLQRRDFANLDDPDRASVTIERQWLSKAKPPRYADPKADSHRTVYIPKRIVPLIVEHLDNYVDVAPTSPLLPSPMDRSRPISQTNFDSHWRAARDKVRPGFKFHDLRHTGLTKYAQTGATLKEIMDRAGHKDEKVALAYQHSTLERDRANVAKM